MSILFRSNTGINYNNIIGGGSNGFPPGDITILDTTVNDGQVWIKWSDPEDTVINGSTISTWAGTVLVRKIGSYPESVEDGTIVIKNTARNIFQDIWFKDIGLTNETTYYYRFFPYNTEGVYNNSSNLVFTATPLSTAGIFSDNTWDQIISATKTDTVPDTWNVGDEKTLELSGAYNMTITLQIWDFNHFDKADGSGKANICLGCKDIYIEDKMNAYDNNSGGWANMTMRSTTIQDIFNSIPSNLRNTIKEVTVAYNPGYTSNILTCTDKVFIPSLYEIGHMYSYTPNLGNQLPIFSDNNSRTKYDMSEGGDGKPGKWWLRTVSSGSSTNVFMAHGKGDYSPFTSPTDNCGVVFCFNI